MSRFTSICLRVALVLVVGGWLSGPNLAAHAQNDPVYSQRLKWDSYLTSDEKTRMPRFRDPKELELQKAFAAAVGVRPSAAQVDAFNKANNDRLAVLTGTINAALPAMTAGWDGARAKPFPLPPVRHAFMVNFAEWQARQALIRTTTVYREYAVLRASNPAAGTAAWLTSLPGYLPRDAIEFKRCTAESDKCTARCAASTGPSRESCLKFCASGSKTCFDHIRWNTYERPLNDSNPLTRIYADQQEMQKDPNYQRAYQAWMLCQHGRNNNAGPEETGQCQRFAPHNAYRPQTPGP